VPASLPVNIHDQQLSPLPFIIILKVINDIQSGG